MPNIKGVSFEDGITIFSGSVNVGDIHYSQADIDSLAKTRTIAQCETAISNYLQGQFSQGKMGEQVLVHIFSLSPFKMTCIVANGDVVIPVEWWA